MPSAGAAECVDSSLGVYEHLFVMFDDGIRSAPSLNGWREAALQLVSVPAASDATAGDGAKT